MLQKVLRLIISKKKKGWKEVVKFFSFDFNPIYTNDRHSSKKNWGFSFVKSVLFHFDLCNSQIITLLLYFLGILEFQVVGNLVSIQLTDIVNISFWNSKLVSKNLFRFSSNINLMLWW